MICATSTPLSAAPLLANGTMAIGTGSVTPEVISILSCARAAPGSATRHSNAAHQKRRWKNSVFIATSVGGSESDFKIAFKQGRIRGRRQGRGAIGGIQNGLLHGIITIAGPKFDIDDLASAYLSQLQR